MSFGIHLFKLSKRFRFILISLALTAFVLAANFWQWPLYQTVFLLLLITPVLVTVALDLDLVFPEHLLFSVFPFLTLILSSLWIRLNPWEWNRVGESFVFLAVTVLIYIELLTLNIINVATIRTIPLKRVALSVYSLIGLFLMFVASFFVLVLSVSPLIKSSLFVLFSFLIFEAILYADQAKALIQSFGETVIGPPRLFLGLNLVLTLVAVEVFIVFLFLKADILLKSVVLVVFNFSVLSIFQHDLQKNLTQKLLREYLLIVGFFLAVLLFTAGQR